MQTETPLLPPVAVDSLENPRIEGLTAGPVWRFVRTAGRNLGHGALSGFNPEASQLEWGVGDGVVSAVRVLLWGKEALGSFLSLLGSTHYLSPAAEPRGCVFVGLECLLHRPSVQPGRPLCICFGFPGSADPPWLTQSNVR